MLWAGGGFHDLDVMEVLRSLLPEGTGAETWWQLESILDLKIRAMLPPVLMSGSGERQVEIGIGGLKVDAVVDLGALIGEDQDDLILHFSMFVSALMGGAIDIDPTSNQLLIFFDDDLDVVIEFESIDDFGYQGQMSALMTQALGLLLPQLLRDATASIPLPEVDLSSLLTDADKHFDVPSIWRLQRASIKRHSQGAYQVDGFLGL